MKNLGRRAEKDAPKQSEISVMEMMHLERKGFLVKWHKFARKARVRRCQKCVERRFAGTASSFSVRRLPAHQRITTQFREIFNKYSVPLSFVDPSFRPRWSLIYILPAFSHTAKMKVTVASVFLVLVVLATSISSAEGRKTSRRVRGYNEDGTRDRRRTKVQSTY